MPTELSVSQIWELPSDFHVLVGACGVNVDPYAGDVSVGRLRHLYVAVAERRRGVGRALTARCLEWTRGRFRVVRLRTNAQNAEVLDGFYGSMGFVKVEGDEYATHQMTLE